MISILGGNRASRNAKGSHLMDIKVIGTGMWYRAENPATLARRLYGRNVHVREEHQNVYQPTYRIWTVVDGHGDVYARFYTEDMSWGPGPRPDFNRKSWRRR